jgi:hypothetical protein
MGKCAKQSGPGKKDPFIEPVELHPSEHPSDPHDARAAIDSGEEALISSYLRGVGAALKLLADQLDPSDVRCGWRVKARGIAQSTGRKRRRQLDADFTWDSDTGIAEECIKNGEAVLTGSWLRDVATFVQYLAEPFDPTSTSHRRLKFARRNRGKPKNPSKMFRDSRVELGLLFNRNKEKKKQTKTSKRAVFDVMERQQVSRATVFRAVGPIKRPKS